LSIHVILGVVDTFAGPRRPVRPIQRVGDIDVMHGRRLSSGAMSLDPDMSPVARSVVLPWMVEGY
jgi:hypothetical protein